MKHTPTKIEQGEIDLFRKDVGDIEQIPQEHIHPIVKPVIPTSKHKYLRQEQQIDDLFSDKFEPYTISAEEKLSFRRSGIQKRLLSRLKNGRFHIEAELDLHGMTIPVARAELAQFISKCKEFNIRCARIIHGKGWGSKQKKPVLKTQLNSWLQQEEDVLAFCSAPIKDGGTGAVYILLRKNKSPPSPA